MRALLMHKEGIWIICPVLRFCFFILPQDLIVLGKAESWGKNLLDCILRYVLMWERSNQFWIVTEYSGSCTFWYKLSYTSYYISWLLLHNRHKISGMYNSMLFVAHVSVGQLERLLQTGVKFRSVPIVLFWGLRWNGSWVPGECSCHSGSLKP